jgi:hypothetical protein
VTRTPVAPCSTFVTGEFFLTRSPSRSANVSGSY